MGQVNAAVIEERAGWKRAHLYLYIEANSGGKREWKRECHVPLPVNSIISTCTSLPPIWMHFGHGLEDIGARWIKSERMSGRIELAESMWTR